MMLPLAGITIAAALLMGSNFLVLVSSVEHLVHFVVINFVLLDLLYLVGGVQNLIFEQSQIAYAQIIQLILIKVFQDFIWNIVSYLTKITFILNLLILIGSTTGLLAILLIHLLKCQIAAFLGVLAFFFHLLLFISRLLRDVRRLHLNVL